MDKKQRLARLDAQYKETINSITRLQGEVIEFEETEDYEEYKDYKNSGKDVLVKAMYSKEDEVYKKIDEKTVQAAAIYDEMINAVYELVKEIDESIASLNAKLEVNKKALKKTETRIKRQQTQINKLKDSEEYKKGDEATLLKVQDLERQLKASFETRDDILNLIKTYEEKSTIKKKEKEYYMDMYGGEIEELEAKKAAEQARLEAEKKAEAEKDKDKDKDKDSKDKSKQQVVAGAPVVEEDPEKKLQKDFEELYSKAKRNALTEKDFDKLAEIMKNPENYDKLGITTGVVFNKAKTIFKALGNVASINNLTAKNAEEKIAVELEKAQEIVKQDRDKLSDDEQIIWDNAQKHIVQYSSLQSVMKVYENVSKERTKAKWGWLIEFEETSKPALPAEPAATKPKDNSFNSKLASQTVKDADYKDVAVKDTKVQTQEQTK